MKFLLSFLFAAFLLVSCSVPTTVPKEEYSRDMTNEAIEFFAEENEKNIFV